MNHEELKKNRLGKRVDFDGWFGYQCVDLAKFYAKEVHSIAFGRTGNAQDWFINSVGVSQWYAKVSYSAWKIAPQWAIIFWQYGKYGHVAIVDSATDQSLTIIEQNGIGDNPTTPKDEAGDGIGGNAIRLRTTNYSNVIWRLVDPITSQKAKASLEWNSSLWKATNLDNVKTILNKANQEIRKSYI